MRIQRLRRPRSLAAAPARANRPIYNKRPSDYNFSRIGLGELLKRLRGSPCAAFRARSRTTLELEPGNAGERKIRGEKPFHRDARADPPRRCLTGLAARDR